MIDTKRRGYAAPVMETAEMPAPWVLCELSGDLVDTEEEDAGITNWEIEL